jgi:hypothetical protein
VSTTSARSRPTTTHAALGDGVGALVLRVVAVAGLAIDVWVHASLQSDYSHVGNTLSQGRLFVAEAVLAGAIGVWLLVTGSRTAWVATFLIAAGGVAAVVLYRYVDVGDIGPIPNMYEPIWFFRKTLSAYAEGAAAFAAAIRLSMLVRR